MKTAAGRVRCCGARICCQLSDAVRGNSDWWKIRENRLYGVMDSCIAEESGYLSPSRIDNCKHAKASISVPGSYSACVTPVSEMSTENWSFHCSVMQVQICVEWYELFKTKYWNYLMFKLNCMFAPNYGGMKWEKYAAVLHGFNLICCAPQFQWHPTPENNLVTKFQMYFAVHLESVCKDGLFFPPQPGCLNVNV